MIIQTAPAGEPRLAIMMYEHTALSHQFARAFGNESFRPADPNDLMFHVTLHHDAGWAEFDRDPPTDPQTDLPFNLVETPGPGLCLLPDLHAGARKLGCYHMVEEMVMDYCHPEKGQTIPLLARLWRARQ